MLKTNLIFLHATIQGNQKDQKRAILLVSFLERINGANFGADEWVSCKNQVL